MLPVVGSPKLIRAYLLVALLLPSLLGCGGSPKPAPQPTPPGPGLGPSVASLDTDEDEDDDDAPTVVAEPTPAADSEPVAPDQPTASQPAVDRTPEPAVPIEPAADPEPVVVIRTRGFETERFSVTISSPWVEAPGAYRGDYGALLTLLPEGDATGRAIDIYREPVVVAPELRHKVQQAMLAKLSEPSVGNTGLTVMPVAGRTVGERELLQAHVTSPDSPERVLKYAWWFSDDGVYTFVLSTRMPVFEEDRAVLHQCVASLTFKDLAAVRQQVRDRLPFAFGRPENWLLSVKGQVATLRAPLRLGEDGELAQVQTTITVTTIGKTFPTEDGAVRFARDVAKELAPAGTPPREREELGPAPVMGQIGGLRSAELICKPPQGELPEGATRRVVIVFGLQQTFVVALNYSNSDQTIADTGFAAFMDRFSESR